MLKWAFVFRKWWQRVSVLQIWRSSSSPAAGGTPLPLTPIRMSGSLDLRRELLLHENDARR
jgi:hypothetical protein